MPIFFFLPTPFALNAFRLDKYLPTVVLEKEEPEGDKNVCYLMMLSVIKII
jgi:hypothetical protein